MNTSPAIGIDKAAGGWVVVMLEWDGSVGVEFVETLQQMTEPAGWVAVDMPLAFPTNGRRTAEIEARRLLGRRVSTLFLTPPAPLVARDWEYARAHGVSKQMWNLVPFIHEARDVRTACWIETHPELVFAALAGEPLPSKKTWNGQMLRRRILNEAGIELDEDLGLAGSAAPDDILDAAACALVASRHPDDTLALGDDAATAIWTLRAGGTDRDPAPGR
jgi:predicted RNase H-like nuclease